MNLYRKPIALSTIVLASSMTSGLALADTPLGWINSSNPSAYTTNKGELEISLRKIAVNDTLDFLNYREDLIKASGRLVGDSGNLSGNRLELNYGITEAVSVFYERQQHSLTLDLGTFQSIDLVDIDDALVTLAESAGMRWVFYRGNLLNPDNRHSAASLEISAFQSESDNFDTVVEEIRLAELTISFGVPQTFSVADMRDEGWKGRLIYSWPLLDTATATIWTGYGESKANSATTSDLQSATLRRFFEQRFEVDEAYLYLGLGLSAQFSPRLHLNVSYEYTSILDSSLERFPLEPLSGLPSFLSADTLTTVDANHAFEARLAYWLTPSLNLSLTGNLFANQFVGVLPHYNNPLSGSFSDTPYGYAGVELMWNLGKVP